MALQSFDLSLQYFPFVPGKRFTVVHSTCSLNKFYQSFFHDGTREPHLQELPLTAQYLLPPQIYSAKCGLLVLRRRSKRHGP
jgi:hypothetical protein